MKAQLAIAAILASLATGAGATGFGKPCTTEPVEKWMKVEAIEKIVADHGYTVLKTKLKSSCAEVYARDKDGTKVELFLDPVTGNPVGVDGGPTWKN